MDALVCGSSRVRSSSYEPPFSPGFGRDVHTKDRSNFALQKLANGPGVGRDGNSKDRSNFTLQTLDKLASNCLGVGVVNKRGRGR